MKTKQHPEIRAFLAEFGFQHLTDWALLNRARKSQFEQLVPADQCLLKAFHGVYRRDRRQQTKQRTKCQTPTEAQLLEMDAYCVDQGYPSRARSYSWGICIASRNSCGSMIFGDRGKV